MQRIWNSSSGGGHQVQGASALDLPPPYPLSWDMFFMLRMLLIPGQGVRGRVVLVALRATKTNCPPLY